MIGLREHLQETPIFNGKNHGFRWLFSLQPVHWAHRKSREFLLLNVPKSLHQFVGKNQHVPTSETKQHFCDDSRLKWYFHDISMIFPWYFHDISIFLKCFFFIYLWKACFSISKSWYRRSPLVNQPFFADLIFRQENNVPFLSHNKSKVSCLGTLSTWKFLDFLVI